MTDTIEGFNYDTSGQDAPEEVTTDDHWQLADVIEQQVEWVLDHRDGSDVHSILRNELRQIEGSASRVKDLRQETVERKLEGQESQTTLEEVAHE